MSKKRKQTWLITAIVFIVILLLAIPSVIDSHKNPERHDKAVSDGIILWWE